MASSHPSGPPPQARPWNPNNKFSFTERERWLCIYPAYINSRKTLQEGRRLPKEQCVENPTYAEIRDVLLTAGLNIGVENKVYARELDHRDPKFRGRIRVQFRKEDGELFNEYFKSKKDLLKYACTMIPKLKSRQQGSQPQQQAQQSQEKKGRKGRKK
ncbi:hypothetical protein FSP39_022169 [Pinctada imbricata]|uniref:Signal recognition particle 19 kDa protein n=1 Tax=Pinctada imbricata TaxID=66713 RepID=A0AA89BU56_PINIB|nr:hypothetical protein FSP39_022169 [Pinctada imbricata]